jgi:hypothetical protein
MQERHGVFSTGSISRYSAGSLLAVPLLLQKKGKRMFDKTREKVAAPVQKLGKTAERIGSIALTALMVSLAALLIAALAMFKGGHHAV